MYTMMYTTHGHGTHICMCGVYAKMNSVVPLYLYAYTHTNGYVQLTYMIMHAYTYHN